MTYHPYCVCKVMEVLFNHVPIVDAIVYHLGGEYLCSSLRASFRAAARAINPPNKMTRKDLAEMAGSSGNLELTKLVMSWPCDDVRTQSLAYAAAFNGHEKVCEFVLEAAPRVAVADTVLLGGAASGSARICEIAIRAGSRAFMPMLGCAGKKGHAHICELARKHGYTNFSWMFFMGVLGHQRHICVLAKSWGAGWPVPEWMLDLLDEESMAIFNTI